MGRPRSLDYAEALRLREQGLSYPEIGRRLGVHHTTALYACNRAYRECKQRTNRARARSAS